jgi:hypothetical protein
MKDKIDRFRVIRRFLYGKDAIKHGINREALVLAVQKDRCSWPFSEDMLNQAIAYLKVQYHSDPYYTKDREAFFNS